MDYINIYIIYGSHSDSFTLTRNTTWTDLCALIQDRSGLHVTQLYHCNDNRNIGVLSTEDEWKCFVYGCTNSWLQLSIHPTLTVNTQKDGLGKRTSKQNNISRHERTSFTTQFESFGKLMDKYHGLIQSDDEIKTMMHQSAIGLTLHQKPSADLAEIEARLEKRLGNATTGTNRRRSAFDGAISTHDRVSLATFDRNHIPDLSRSTTLPSNVTVPSSLCNQVKRRSSASTHSTHHQCNAQPRITSTPSSYTPLRTVKGTILGEWPAYSSLYPPPQSTHTTTVDDSTPLLSLLDSNIHYELQKSPVSLYPQPPTMISQSDRTNRTTQNWLPSSSSSSSSSSLSLSPPPSLSAEISSSSAMKPNAISKRLSTISYGSNNSSDKHLSWYDDNYQSQQANNDPWKSSKKRQSYKEQHRALKLQQKELERTIRQLKRQEKLDKKEYRKKLQHHDQVGADDINNRSIRKSSSLSSLSSSVSSIYSASSALNDSCLQQQNHHLEPNFYFPTTAAPSTERLHRNMIGRVDDQHQHHYGLNNNAHLQLGFDKTSHDHGGGVTFLADSLDQLSINDNPGLYSHESVV